ncbi:MAG: diaminopimelate epimerase [Pseudomonadota bacterium]
MTYFLKMHGLGNDFVIIDGRETGITLTPEQVRLMSDRKRGIGCDLVVLIKYSKNFQEIPFLHLINSDGSEIEACGNATRCVADVMMHEEKMDHIVLETLNGSLNCWRDGEDQVRVEMGVPKLKWDEIPLSEECDTNHLPLENDPAAANIGNPHCVFFVDDIAHNWGDSRVEKVGRQFESHPLFPNKTNVEFIEILSRDHIRMRIWERGCGITEACGSGACAVAVAAIRRGLVDRKVRVTLDGGDLIINWPSDDAQISMTGPVSYVYEGETSLLD